MEEEKLGKLLDELTERTAETVRPGLADDIKGRILHKLAPHRGGMDTINIIIDLRISKLAAAAAIIITMVLCANFLGGGISTNGSIYRDGKTLVKYFLGGSGIGGSEVSVYESKYEHLVQEGKDVVYYGDSVDPKDSNSALMQWKLPDGRYKVIFRDLREETVSAEELIKLQSRMLQKRVK